MMLRRKAPPIGAAEAAQAARLAEGEAALLLANGERLRRKHSAAWKVKPERARAAQARAAGVLPGRTGWRGAREEGRGCSPAMEPGAEQSAKERGGQRDAQEKAGT